VPAQVNTLYGLYFSYPYPVHIYSMFPNFSTDQQSPGRFVLQDSPKKTAAETKRMRERGRYTSMSPDQMDGLLKKRRDYNVRRRSTRPSNCTAETSPGIVHAT
jgi:hypothetical protein